MSNNKPSIPVQKDSPEAGSSNNIKRQKKAAAKPVKFSERLAEIAERNQAAEATIKSEAELKFITEAIPQKIFTAEPNGEVDYFNRQWTEFTGISFEKIKKWGWLQFIHPDDVDENIRQWKHSIATGEPFEFEHRFKRADGVYRWHLSRARALRNKAGEIIKWVGSNTDITETKQQKINADFLAQASKVLSSSLDYDKTLATLANLVIPDIADWCSIDMNQNDNSLRNIALSHRDPKKVAWAHKMRQQFPTDMNAPTGLAKVIKTGSTEYYPLIDDNMLEASAKNASHLQLLRRVGFKSVIITPLAVSGKVIGAITLVTTDQNRAYTPADVSTAEELAHRASLAINNASLYESAQQEITQRQQLEEKLRDINEKLEARVEERTRLLEESNQNLERSNQELQDFAYVASHDLQEPLRKIQAFGNLLQDEYGEQLKDGADYLNRMRSAASRMSILIEDLLAFSRITTKARPFVKVDLNIIAQEVIEDLETRIESTRGTVVVDALPVITADPVQMRQLLQNLIGNALKFHRKNIAPDVRVHSRSEVGKNGKIKYHYMQVADNGIGFNEKYLDRIFSVFQRLHGRDTYEGTGIGLAVCRKIVERHGGSISAISTEGKGSTFIIKLPARISRKAKA